MKEIYAIDVNYPGTKSGIGGVAYFRIDDRFYKFLQLCKEKHGIIGFEWDQESRNFGIIVGKD